MNTAFSVMIPSRYASTRLPGKPLLDICGKTLIQHVCERAAESRAGRVVVATDHEGIFEHIEATGFKAVMTSGSCQSGTDRIAEAAAVLGLNDEEIIVNLQGDEPFMPSAIIDQVAMALAASTGATMSTACEVIDDPAMLGNPDVVKVVRDKNNHALYFSRAGIPHDRDDAGVQQACRHLGIYAYTSGYIRQFAARGPCPLEQTEKLEQLRALWHGERIVVTEVNESTGIGVDTAQDLEKAREYFHRRAS